MLCDGRSQSTGRAGWDSTTNILLSERGGGQVQAQVQVQAQAGREGRLLSNPFGVAGHDWCTANLPGQEERRGQCYNELECLATGGQIQGYCEAPVGSNILVS